MPRRPRRDQPDTWHHVMNRGIARRSIFENRGDYRFFLSLLAREVRAGRLEVHAYSLLMTHFHMLVRSPTGELRKVMHRVQMRYSRRFNRSRRRDGSLVRGRYFSKHVDSLWYRRNVVTYIHDNATAAGLAADPWDHDWCSAAHLVRERRPRWLATGWVDDESARRGSGESLAERLATAFPTRLDPEFRSWVQRELYRRWPAEWDDCTLAHAGSPKVIDWAVRKAELADATRPFETVCPPNAVDEVITMARKERGPLTGLFPSASKDAWTAMRAALLYTLSGCTHREIAMRVGRHSSTISRDVQDHADLKRTVPWYRALAAQLALRAGSKVR